MPSMGATYAGTRHGALKMMAKCGFGEEPIRCAEGVSPVSLCQPPGLPGAVLYSDKERDVALIRADVRAQDGKRRVVWQITDRKDLETGFTAMQRTVGFRCR